jgi:hypothetical protein
VEKNIGIVLKQCSQKNNIIFVLDYKNGKIKCIHNKNNILTGSIINYFITNNKSPYFIESIELLQAPFEIATDDILFLHHILEICDLFLPAQHQAKEIFNLIVNLYKFESEIKNRNKKKLFIFKLLTLLGIYPEEARFRTAYFHCLATESIDNIILKNLNSEDEQELNNWLHCCITVQQEFSKFKTINFIYHPIQVTVDHELE